MEKTIVFALLCAALCFGSSLKPFVGELYQIDQIYKFIGEPALRAEAVGLLTAMLSAMTFQQCRRHL
jgi:hypothetical protein